MKPCSSISSSCFLSSRSSLGLYRNVARNVGCAPGMRSISCSTPREGGSTLGSLSGKTSENSPSKRNTIVTTLGSDETDWLPDGTTRDDDDRRSTAGTTGWRPDGWPDDDDRRFTVEAAGWMPDGTTSDDDDRRPAVGATGWRPDGLPDDEHDDDGCIPMEAACCWLLDGTPSSNNERPTVGSLTTTWPELQSTRGLNRASHGIPRMAS